MNEYTILLRKILEKNISVSADTVADAISEVENAFFDDELTLTNDDYADNYTIETDTRQVTAYLIDACRAFMSQPDDLLHFKDHDVRELLVTLQQEIANVSNHLSTLNNEPELTDEELIARLNNNPEIFNEYRNYYIDTVQSNIDEIMEPIIGSLQESKTIVGEPIKIKVANPQQFINGMLEMHQQRKILSQEILSEKDLELIKIWQNEPPNTYIKNVCLTILSNQLRKILAEQNQINNSDSEELLSEKDPETIKIWQNEPPDNYAKDVCLTVLSNRLRQILTEQSQINNSDIEEYYVYCCRMDEIIEESDNIN